MSVNNDNLLLDVLRAAGHADAAELASKVLAHGAPPAEKPSDADPPPPAGPSLMPPAAFAEQDARRAEGQAMVDQMRRQGILPAAPTGEAA